MLNESLKLTGPRCDPRKNQTSTDVSNEKVPLACHWQAVRLIAWQFCERSNGKNRVTRFALLFFPDKVFDFKTRVFQFITRDQMISLVWLYQRLLVAWSRGSHDPDTAGSQLKLLHDLGPPQTNGEPKRMSCHTGAVNNLSKDDRGDILARDGCSDEHLSATHLGQMLENYCRL